MFSFHFLGYLPTEFMQKSKAAKVDGGQGNNSSKSSLLHQLGLVPAVDTNTSPSSEASSNLEKTEPEGGEKRKEADNVADPFLPEDRPVQKNRKKCWICKTKLELAQRELGSCKCGK